MVRSKKANAGTGLLLGLGLFFAVVYGFISAVFNGWVALLLFTPVLPVIFVLRDFRVGAVFLMFLLPFQSSPILPQFSGFNVVNFIVLATIASMMINRFSNKAEFAHWPPIFWWGYMAPILAGALLGLMHLKQVPDEMDLAAYRAPYLYLTNVIIKPLFTVLAAWVLATAVIRSKRKELFLIPLTIAAVLPAFLLFAFIAKSGMSLKVLGGMGSREVLGVLGMHANGFGQYFGIGFTMLLFLTPLAKGFSAKCGLYLALGIVFAALMLTFSRGGYAVALTGALAFVVLHRKVRYAFLLAAAMVVLALFLPEAIIDRVTESFGPAHVQTTIGAARIDPLTAGRIWLWKQLLPGFWHSPLWGSGVGAVAWSDPVRRGMFAFVHPHNVFLRALLDVGLLGFTVLFLFFRYIVLGCLRVARAADSAPMMVALGQGVAAATVAMFIGDFAGGHYISGPEQVILWLGIGMLLPSLVPLMEAHKAAKRKARGGAHPLPAWAPEQAAGSTPGRP